MSEVPRSGWMRTIAMGMQTSAKTLPMSFQLNSLPASPQK